MGNGATDADRENVRRWLAGRIAEFGKAEATSIGPDVPLAVYGLDSVNAVTLVVDIEEHYDLVLEPDALWEFNTIDALADHILAG
jgi:acyl carrier protein